MTPTKQTKIIRESDVTTKLLKEIRTNNPTRFVWKIPDIGNVQKPFDVIGIKDGGQAFAREIKVIRTKKCDYQSVYQHLELHQIINLNKVREAGGDAQLVAFHQATDRFIFYPF